MHSAIILAGIMAQDGTLKNARYAYRILDHPTESPKREDICERNTRRRLYSERLDELSELCGILPEYWERKPRRR